MLMERDSFCWRVYCSLAKETNKKGDFFIVLLCFFKYIRWAFCNSDFRLGAFLDFAFLKNRFGFDRFKTFLFYYVIFLKFAFTL